MSTASRCTGPRPSEVLETELGSLSANTRHAYRRGLRLFLTTLPQLLNHQEAPRDLDELGDLLGSMGAGESNLLVRRYQNHLRYSPGGRALSARTINLRIAAVRFLCRCLHGAGLIDWSPQLRTLKVRKLSAERPATECIVTVLQYLAGQVDPRGLRDHTIARLAHDLGLRLSEVRGLDVSDVDLRSNTLFVLGKGRHERDLLTIPRPTAQSLRRWLDCRGDQAGPLFNPTKKSRARLSSRAIQKGWHAACESAGVKPLRFHALRRAAITRACQAAARSGLPVEEVTRFSRHQSLQMLLVYRDLAEDVQGKLASMVADSV